MSTYTQKALAAASALLLGVPTTAYAQPGVLPPGYIGVVQGNTPNTWQTYTYTYTPSTSGANFVGFAFRQDPAFWSFDNAALYAPNSNTNLFTNGDFTTGGSFSITTNNGPSNIQAPTNWGVWYQEGTYPAAAGTWTNGMWYDGAVGTFDGIYQGVNLDAGTQYTISFSVSGNNTANTSSIQLGTYAGLCQDTTLAPAQCTIPSSYGFATLATPAQGAAAGNPTPTVVSTSTANQVTTSVSTTNTSATSQVTYDVSNLDGNGYGTVQNYTDTVETTTPVTTTTTTTTPVTTTTYSDGSTTTSNGTPVVTMSTSNGTPTSQVTGTVLNYTSTIAPSVSSAIAASQTLPAVTTRAYNYATNETGGQQRVRKQTVTTVTTPMVTTTTTTPVTTTVYANGTTSVTNGTPSYSYAYSNDVAVSDSYDYYYGRVDQLEVLDGINDGINGLLNHEPTAGKQRLRVFENNRFVQSYNADGYTADSKIFGGGFEFDVTKGWTLGGQYNRVNVNLNGVDSSTQQSKDHFGVFSELRGNTLTLNTNAAIANSNYKYNRNVEGVFNNVGETTGTEWWVSNRLYWHLHKAVKPFVGYTVWNNQRNAYTETGSIQSARSVDAFNQTTHVGEAGLKLETRFGGKKKDLFGISVEGAYGTDSSYGVSASIDYKEMLFVEGSHGVNNGVTNNSVAAKVEFKF